MIRVDVDINNLRNTKNSINNTYNELLIMFNKYKEMIEDTNTICDTEAANYFRSVAKEYMEYEIVNVNKEFTELQDKLTEATCP